MTHFEQTQSELEKKNDSGGGGDWSYARPDQSGSSGFSSSSSSSGAAGAAGGGGGRAGSTTTAGFGGSGSGSGGGAKGVGGAGVVQAVTKDSSVGRYESSSVEGERGERGLVGTWVRMRGEHSWSYVGYLCTTVYLHILGYVGYLCTPLISTSGAIQSICTSGAIQSAERSTWAGRSLVHAR